MTALEPLDNTEGGGKGTSLTIGDAGEILTDAHLGDSICINGSFHSVPIPPPLLPKLTFLRQEPA